MTQPKFIDEIGNKYGKLTVIERDINTVYGTSRWICKCECGKTTVARSSDLRSGRKTHCGCENKTTIPINNYQRIKRMDIDEMAEFSAVFQRCEFCVNQEKGIVSYHKCRETTCKEAIKQWLMQEAKDEN